MLRKLMLMYLAYMNTGSTGLIPHLVGPPGSGKSTVVENLAELLDVNLHIISVARLNSLEVEGVQMPVVVEGEHLLKMLPATFWTSLEEGDIILYDEFLRGFPEVYNALLDVFTSRRVGAYRLPKVFMMAASNSITAYDPALGDRMLNIPVADPRKKKSEKSRLATIMVQTLGLHPYMKEDYAMLFLLENEVLPTFNVLDQLMDKKGNKTTAQPHTGKSLRNLIAQVQLRYVVTGLLKELIEANNKLAMSTSKAQYVILLSGVAPKGYESAARRLVGNPALTPVQAANLALNLEMIDLERARFEKEEDEEDE